VEKDFWIWKRAKLDGREEKFGQMGRKGGGDGAIGKKADKSCT
jgi:hypothetical protein